MFEKKSAYKIFKNSDGFPVKENLCEKSRCCNINKIKLLFWQDIGKTP